MSIRTEALLEAYARPREMTLACASCHIEIRTPIKVGAAVWDLQLSDARRDLAKVATEVGWRITNEHHPLCPECAHRKWEHELL